MVKDAERGYEPEMKPGTYHRTRSGSGLVSEWLAVRTSGNPTALVPAVRRVISEIDPDQPISTIQTMDEILDLERHRSDAADDPRWRVCRTGAAAGVSGTLCGAVVPWSAASAAQIGLRIALGANSGSVVGDDRETRRGADACGPCCRPGPRLGSRACDERAALCIGASDPVTVLEWSVPIVVPRRAQRAGKPRAGIDPMSPAK